MTATERGQDPIASEVAPYEEWQQAEGIPVHTGFCIEDLRTAPVGHWARMGGKGAFINLVGSEMSSDAYLCEIPPGGSLNRERHMYEEMMFVIEGRGATVIYSADGRGQTFEWGPGSLFSMPLNASHQLFNGQGDKPARYVAMTNAPLAINLYHNLDFIFNNPYNFGDRYSGEQGYFSGQGKLLSMKAWETNFISNVYDFQLRDLRERGAMGLGTMLEMSDNTMACHISQFPVGTYKKAHRHGSSALLIILAGQGYSLLWEDGGERLKVDWRQGSMFSNGNDRWFHQHFNSGGEPARYLALHWGSRKYGRLSFICTRRPPGWVDIKKGGTQIEYEDEDPAIRQLFEAELAKVGAKINMPPVGGR
ncbi:MAG: cupin domain-containing protein [Chloroflexi bacterium]|nr:cupin domain-containing protein [Chloroflexota bacterium]